MKWDDVPCFFNAGSKSSIPYDIFAASFFLISRYEEYLPHVRDKHERFNPEQSIAYKFRFLEKPVVDLWAMKLKEVLSEKFPKFEFPEREFNYISTIVMLIMPMHINTKALFEQLEALSMTFFT